MASINLQGDTSGAITISAPSVAGTNTLTLPATTQTLATQNALGVRNLIINGDMRIAQRGTSVTGISTNNYYLLDRFKIVNNTTTAAFDISQSTDVPTGQGFSNSLKLDTSTVKTTLTGNDEIGIQQRIEGQNLQHLKYSTSNAEQLTLSFWVKSNKTGTYVIWFYRTGTTRHIQKQYTIASADTWEKKTLTIDGDATGAIANDNSNQFEFLFCLATGPDRSSGTAPTTWQTIVNADRYVGQTVNLADSTSNYINITGVQLEVGEEATPFEHRPYDMELARCQRYYITWCEGSNKFLGISNNYTPTTTYVFMDLPVTMRTTPSLDHVTGTDYYRSLSNNIGDNFNNLNLWGQSNINSVGLFVNTNLSVTQGYAGMVITNNTAAYIGFSAEL